MKINCKHGFFLFHEQRVGEVAKFSALFEVEIVPYRGAYTFKKLLDAKNYCLAGKLYLNLPALYTHEGEPWEIFKKNEWVYDLSLGLIVPIATVLTNVVLSKTEYFYFLDRLIQPGSIYEQGGQVTDYTAWYSWDTLCFRYTEIELNA